MTDIGAVIRAINLGFPDKIIANTLGITISTLNLIKKDFEEIKSSYDQGRTWIETADLTMKDKGVVWYAYHILESSKEELEAEILAEKDGTARLKPPPEHPEGKGSGKQEDPKKTETKEKPKGNKRKEGKEITKGEIDDSLRNEAARPSGEVLMEDAGNIGRELALKRQEIGKFVMDTMDSAARDLGFTDHKTFLEAIFTYYIQNYGTSEQKDEQIKELTELAEALSAKLSEDTRKKYIILVQNTHVMETLDRGLPLKPENLLAHFQYLEELLKPISTENLLKIKPGEILNGIAKTIQ